MTPSSEHSRWQAPKIPTASLQVCSNQKKTIFSLGQYKLHAKLWTFKSIPQLFTNELASVIIPFWEVITLAAINLIVPPVSWNCPFPWFEAKRFWWTFRLNLFCYHNRQLAIKLFFNWELVSSDHIRRMLSPLQIKKGSKVSGNINTGSLERIRSSETTAVIHSCCCKQCILGFCVDEQIRFHLDKNVL